MNWRQEYKSLLWILGFFTVIYFMPLDHDTFENAIFDSLALLQWYAREHVLLCLIPAFFIAGVIAVFISQASVIKYFGAAAKKWLSYLIASVSGSVLAVCSCTILPLFAGIYKRGAGLGPAVTFLYSGPAINIMAIILTARILGLEIGIARIIGAIFFAIIIGLVMNKLFASDEANNPNSQINEPESENSRPLWQTSLLFFTLVAILIFATWSDPDTISGIWYQIYQVKWWITSLFGILFALILIYILKIKSISVLLAGIPVIVLALLFPGNIYIPFSGAIISLSVLLSLNHGEPQEWYNATWGFARQILPLLAAGVLIAGFLLGTPNGGSGIIPSEWISGLVGGNSVSANLFASVIGAFMYFATLTEIPILEGLLSSSIKKRPAI